MAFIGRTVSSGYVVWNLGGQQYLFLTATGEVPTSGWHDAYLSPRFYIQPPLDGVWDFDFMASAPAGPVLNIQLPLTAQFVSGAPPWLRGVRIHDATNPAVAFNANQLQGVVSVPAPAVKPSPSITLSRAIYTQDLASFDDSIQPTGNTKWENWAPHAEMKKLHHSLVLTVSGPDENQIRSCINQAVGAGLIAAIVAVYATGGGGLSAATSAFLSALTSCLGNAYEARIDDRSYWITWWT